MMLNIIISFFIILNFLYLIFCLKTKSVFSFDISRNISSFFRMFAAFFIVIGHISQRLATKTIINLFFVQYSHLMVGIFFLLSGYGNRLSIEKEKKVSYKWILKRILPLLFYYIFGFIFNLILNSSQYYCLNDYLIDLITMSFRPNSMWYLNVILALYIVTYLLQILNKIEFVRKFKFFKELVILSLTILYIAICVFFKIENKWWTSVIAYPIGYIYPAISNKFHMKKRYFCVSLVILLITGVLETKINLIKPLCVTSLCVSLIGFCYYFTSKDVQLVKKLGGYSLGIYLYHIIILTCVVSIIYTWFSPLIVIIGSLILTIAVDFLYKIIIGRLLK